jgi:hypothetical protein
MHLAHPQLAAWQAKCYLPTVVESLPSRDSCKHMPADKEHPLQTTTDHAMCIEHVSTQGLSQIIGIRKGGLMIVHTADAVLNRSPLQGGGSIVAQQRSLHPQNTITEA